MLMIDFSSAYDRVNRQTLITKLKEKKIVSSKRIELIQFLLANSKVRIGEKAVASNNGVPQGSTIAPMLFNIYIEELMEQLVNKNISAFMFADDLILIGSQRELEAGN